MFKYRWYAINLFLLCVLGAIAYFYFSPPPKTNLFGDASEYSVVACFIPPYNELSEVLYADKLYVITNNKNHYLYSTTEFIPYGGKKSGLQSHFLWGGIIKDASLRLMIMDEEYIREWIGDWRQQDIYEVYQLYKEHIASSAD